MSNKSSAFLLAAPKSNSGKTMVSLALMQSLVKRGITVQPFKCGPDYIDPMYHSKISGRPSYNLDSWMASPEHIRTIFTNNHPIGGVSIIEGVMGLFDGADKDKGSSAEIARLLNIPIVLVVDGASMAYSAAPLLFGFKNFDKRLKIAGVIFNKVSGESHYRFLKEAAEDAGIEPLGFLPRHEQLAVESRHLGLHLPGENKMKLFDIAAALTEKHILVNRLLAITRTTIEAPATPHPLTKQRMTIAMAHDEAFNFSYSANIDRLKQMGKVIPFSPIHDNQLPPADLLWLPGGYPELHTAGLSKNTAIQEAIRRFIEQGKPVVAECGGMMYLGKELIDENGNASSMCGIFDFSTSFQHKKLHLGYRQTELPNLILRGHEFHYSNLILPNAPLSSPTVKNARGITVEMPIFKYKNCWASYMHLYLGEEDKMQQFITALTQKHE